MSVEITIDDRASTKIAALIDACGDAGRVHLHQVAANAVANQIQRHIAHYAAGKHTTARELGAKITGHYEKGSAAISSHGGFASGTVVIPIPGIQRAWHDLNITAKKGSLTIPVHQMSYGRRVLEMEALGWKVWSPKKKDGATTSGILMGRRDGEVAALYILRKSVHQPKDPTLLPSKDEIGKTAAESAVREVMRIIRKTRSAA